MLLLLLEVVASTPPLLCPDSGAGADTNNDQPRARNWRRPTSGLFAPRPAPNGSRPGGHFRLRACRLASSASYESVECEQCWRHETAGKHQPANWLMENSNSGRAPNLQAGRPAAKLAIIESRRRDIASDLWVRKPEVHPPAPTRPAWH